MCLEYEDEKKKKYGNIDDLINSLLDRAQFYIRYILCTTQTLSLVNYDLK